jgi:hypothetical protein
MPTYLHKPRALTSDASQISTERLYTNLPGFASSGTAYSSPCEQVLSHVNSCPVCQLIWKKSIEDRAPYQSVMRNSATPLVFEISPTVVLIVIIAILLILYIARSR